MKQINPGNIVQQAYEELRGGILEMIRDVVEELLKQARSSIIGRIRYQ
jgi:hypothetical protein